MIDATDNPNIAKRRAMNESQIAHRQIMIAQHFDQYATRNYVPSPFAGIEDLIHEEENYEPWCCDGCLADVDYIVMYELDHEHGRESDIDCFKLCRECAIENWDYIRDFDK